MKTAGLMIVAALALAACGGGDRVKRNYGGASVPRAAAASFASGPISQACLRSDRKAASRALCGCIQTVANRDLSGGDQRKAAKFFADPHQAQEVRQSDNAGNEAFWKRYKTFAARAEQSCQGL